MGTLREGFINAREGKTVIIWTPPREQRPGLTYDPPRAVSPEEAVNFLLDGWKEWGSVPHNRTDYALNMASRGKLHPRNKFKAFAPEGATHALQR